MTSAKQVEANRQNAMKSTGPRTAAGKSVTRMNAVSHGLRAEQILIPGEDENEFAQLKEQLFEQFQPEGVLEEQLLDEILAGIWRKRRLVRVEAGILTRQMFDDREHSWFWAEIEDDEDEEEGLTKEERASRELVALGKAFAWSANQLSLLSRYETGISRGAQRAVLELRRLHAARDKEILEQQVIVDVNEPSPGKV